MFLSKRLGRFGSCAKPLMIYSLLYDEFSVENVTADCFFDYSINVYFLDQYSLASVIKCKTSVLLFFIETKV